MVTSWYKPDHNNIIAASTFFKMAMSMVAFSRRDLGGIFFVGAMTTDGGDVTEAEAEYLKNCKY